MKSEVTFNPDGMILGANPAQLDCRDLLSEIKASERTPNIRVLMLSLEGRLSGLLACILALMMAVSAQP
jgi:hypothetical protein